MLAQLKQKFAQNFAKLTPDWLFAYLIVLYQKLHPHRENISLFFRNGSWLAVREDGLKFFMPTPKCVWVIPHIKIYERFFEVKRGDTVLDIGAAIGGFTLLAAKKAGDGGMVVAIEPEPMNLFALEASVRANELTNVRVIKRAAWNCKKTLRLHLSGNWNIGTHSLIYGHEGRDVEVQADTLDNIVSELGISKVDFLKMDIEGAELEALQGAERTLNITEKIVIAAYHVRNGEKTSSEVSSLLREKGFKVMCVDDHVYGVR